MNKFILILSVVTGLQGFSFLSYRSGYRYLSKQMANYAATYDSSAVATNWIKQPLDHFNIKETRTWKMRYLENFEFWKPNGPIYLFIGGEGEADTNWLTAGLLYDLAKETSGAMIASEHRFYGKSIPLDTSQTKNLKYLSSRQALADLSYLLKAIRSSDKFKDSTKSKVVAVGSSYAGNLATWMRLLYPNEVDAALASSAPILAKKNFYEYLEKVSDDYKQYGTEGCSDKIAEIFQRYDKLFKTDEGIKQLKIKENICEGNDMTKSENRQLFFLVKTNKFLDNSQLGTPNDIKTHCQSIMNSNLVVSSKQIALEDEPNFWLEDGGCSDFDYNNSVYQYKNDSSWFYQQCTEFGYFISTKSDNQLLTRNVPVDLFYKICIDVFGSEFGEERIDKGVAHTNHLYGGLTPNVTQVVFVNGDMDPWSRLSPLKNVSYDAPAIVIPRATHSEDLLADTTYDSKELLQARAYEKYLVKKWLGLGDS